MEIDRSNFFGHMRVMSIFVILRPTHFVLTHAFIENIFNRTNRLTNVTLDDLQTPIGIYSDSRDALSAPSTHPRSCFFGIIFNSILNVT